MNKVVTINLGGNAYQLEEGGYDLLRNYLETAEARLRTNPDREEILSDIEGAIGEKFRALVSDHKTVVIAKEVSTVLAEMGPIESGGDNGEKAEAGGPTATPNRGGSDEKKSPKRLYRISEGSMIAGVCEGLAAYLNVDSTFVRLAFVVLTILWGTGLLVYLIMAIVVPEAKSPEEIAAASGLPSTAQEFIRRAKAGYYEAVKNFQDPKTRHYWGRRFRRGMRGSRHYWTSQWGSRWTPPAPPFRPWMGVALPMFSLFNGAVMITATCAFISLLATGAVFGVALPVSIPLWLGAVLLLILYAVVAGSLKTMRRLFWWSADASGQVSHAVWLTEAAIGFLVLMVLALLAIHFFPELRGAIQAFPSVMHQAVADIQNWWRAK